MIVVIGCGNLNRSDDGVGVEVIRALQARAASRADLTRPRPEARFLDAGTDGMAVLFAARGCSTLIVVDASRSGGTPGSIFEGPGQEFEQPHQAALNLHDFRWDNALHAGRQIFREAFPRDVIVILIEVRSLALGLGLSPEVREAAVKVCDRVEELIVARGTGPAR